MPFYVRILERIRNRINSEIFKNRVPLSFQKQFLLLKTGILI